MAILRAGPWGNLTDSFQDVPGDTGADGLTLYPVNCAKTDWLSGQAWGAYYEVVESGCCNPATITIAWSYYDFSASTLRSYTEQLTRGDSCNYYRETAKSCSYYGNTVEYISVFWNNGFWTAEGGSDCFASIEAGDGSTDICDPTGTYVIYNLGGLPVGRSWTITTP